MAGKYVVRYTKERTCAVCGHTFYSNKPNATFCGGTCRVAYSRAKEAFKKEAAKLQFKLWD